MQLRNNSELDNFQMLACVNYGKTVKGRDHLTGEVIDKLVKPEMKLIHIPPLATVEIDDELWAAATIDTMRDVPIYEVTKEEIKNVGFGKDNEKKFYKTVRTNTGKTERKCIIQMRIDSGELTIIEHPKSKLTKEEMQQALKDKGIPTSKETELGQVQELYNKVCL